MSSPDLLARLRALNPVPGDDTAPPFGPTRAAIDAMVAPAHPIAAPPRRVRRVAALGLAGAATAVAITAVVASGPAQQATHRSSPLGALQTAQAVAAANPVAARFSGFSAETRSVTSFPGGAPTVEHTWKIVHKLSDTTFEGRLERLVTADQAAKVPEAIPRRGVGVITDGTFSQRREGDAVRVIERWVRPYGTLFNGALAPGRKPSPVPTDPAVAAKEVSGWATGRDGSDREQNDLLHEAAGSGHTTEHALYYAEDVLTAPRVSPAVRAAVYEALGRTPGFRVVPNATDPAGRPAAALVTAWDHGPSHTKAELLIDPATARVLGTRYVFTVAPGTNDHLKPGEVPYGTGSSQTTYRYDDEG